MTFLDLLIGFGMAAMAVAAAVWIIASGGSDSNAMFMLFLSVAVLGWTTAEAYSQQQIDRWIEQFPGPIAISAPTWQRVLLCLSLLALAGLFLSAAATGKAGRSDDWEFYRMVVGGGIGFLVGMGALCQLPRRELVLSFDRLEYRSPWGKHSYRWSEFSKFYLVNSRWKFLVCEFAHQSHRNWFVRRGLMMTAPLGLSKYALRTLLIAWHARALSTSPVSAAASRAMAPDWRPRGRSLLDYAQDVARRAGDAQ
jgi:hypothetical protein